MLQQQSGRQRNPNFPTQRARPGPRPGSTKIPMPLTERALSPTQTEKTSLADESSFDPQHISSSFSLQLRELVQKYLFKSENYQDKGEDMQSTPDEKLVYPEKHTEFEMTRGAKGSLLGMWSPVGTSPSGPAPLLTQEEARCPPDAGVTKTLEPHRTDSKHWPPGEQMGTPVFYLSHRPYLSALSQRPQAAPELFHGVESQVNTTPVTVDTAAVERMVLQYPQTLASAESFHGVKSQVEVTLVNASEQLILSLCSMEACKVEEDAGAGGSVDRLLASLPGGDPGDAADSKSWFLPEADAETETYSLDGDHDHPEVNWHDDSDVEEMECEERSFRGAAPEDRSYVCPVRLQMLMAHAVPDEYIGEEESEGFATAKVLGWQSLRLVYSTIEESLPEGTVQLLSDLLQPGFYPPKDITTHLLRGILLGPCRQPHLQVQAFELLMKTQRHHREDKSTIPWDWELLTSVMDNQGDPAKRHRSEVVPMLLEYVVRTMEDDFRAQLSSSALKQSIARAFLSCNFQITKVKEVIKWMCAAVVKATAGGGGDHSAREKDDHIRVVLAFQKMLSMALEVDCFPVLSTETLSQLLFHMLLIGLPLRSHRKLLLDGLQSELLKCKLLQHLLEHSCPEKTSMPMSFSLMLHFLRHSIPSQDATDGDDKWPKWEELVELLWMLLLCYNKVNKGDLRRPITEKRDGASKISTPHDEVSRVAVCEAVESLLSRSQADLGHALPDHVEESLSYLQDHLLDVCQP